MVDFETTNFSTDSKVLDDILFNRPIKSVGRHRVALLVTRNASLRSIDKVYEIFKSFGLNCALVVDERLSIAQVPAEIVLKSSHKVSYSNVDEALELIQDCSALFVLTGGEINAAMGLLIAKLADRYAGFVLADDKQIFGQSWKKASKVVIGPTRKLLKDVKAPGSRESGLRLKADYLFGVSKIYDCSIIATDPNQALALNHENRDSVAVVNSEYQIDPMALSAIIFALLAEKATPIDGVWLNYILVAGYLYRNHYQKKGPQALGRYLNSQF